MKKILLIISALSLAGCHSHLLGTHDDAKQPDPATLSSGYPTAGICPEIQSPDGFTATSFYGVLKSPYAVSVGYEPSSTLFVLIRDVGTWFKLGTTVSGAYYYVRTSVDQVTYKGPYPEGKEYCIYQFIPAA